MATGPPSLAAQFLSSSLDIACPVCEADVWVRFAEIVAECVVTCAVCRSRIQLRDDRASAQTAAAAIEAQIQQAFKGLFK